MCVLRYHLPISISRTYVLVEWSSGISHGHLAFLVSIHKKIIKIKLVRVYKSFALLWFNLKRSMKKKVWRDRERWKREDNRLLLTSNYRAFIKICYIKRSETEGAATEAWSCIAAVGVAALECSTGREGRKPPFVACGSLARQSQSDEFW